MRVSNQESDTRYAAVEKNVSARDVYFAFQRAVRRILEALRSRDYPLHSAQIIEADTLGLSPDRIGRIG